jgi:hypothetical protein
MLCNHKCIGHIPLINICRYITDFNISYCGIFDLKEI